MEASGEVEVCWSFPDWQVTTFAVDCTNQRAVLAVQKWLAVIDLKDTTKVKTDRKLGRTSKYEVKAVLWNPHHVNKDLLVSTSQQKLEIWNVVAERSTLVHSVKAHSRPVSDVSWSFKDPNLLASCAMDSFINVWDLRETRRAKTYFKAVVGMFC
jgi:WD40 repeat protein